MYTDYANVVNKMVRVDLLNSFNNEKTARKCKSGGKWQIVAKSGESAKPHKYCSCGLFFKLRFFCLQQDKAKIRIKTEVRKKRREILWKWESNIL